MAKIYDNPIEQQYGFKYTERVVADDRTEVQSLADLTTLVVPPHFVTFVRDVLDENGLPTPFQWNGLDQTNLANWINPLADLKQRTTDLENETAALTSGVRYAIPQSGNTPTTEPAPTQNGIYRVKTINATYTNFGGIVVPNDAGFIYDIQVSGLPSTPVYTLLPTDVNITIDAVPTDGSTNAVQSNGVFDAIAEQIQKPIFNQFSLAENGKFFNASSIIETNSDYAYFTFTYKANEKCIIEFPSALNATSVSYRSLDTLNVRRVITLEANEVNLDYDCEIFVNLNKSGGFSTDEFDLLKNYYVLKLNTLTSYREFLNKVSKIPQNLYEICIDNRYFASNTLQTSSDYATIKFPYTANEEVIVDLPNNIGATVISYRAYDGAATNTIALDENNILILDYNADIYINLYKLGGFTDEVLRGLISKNIYRDSNYVPYSIFKDKLTKTQLIPSTQFATAENGKYWVNDAIGTNADYAYFTFAYKTGTTAIIEFPTDLGATIVSYRAWDGADTININNDIQGNRLVLDYDAQIYVNLYKLGGFEDLEVLKKYYIIQQEQLLPYQTQNRNLDAIKGKAVWIGTSIQEGVEYVTNVAKNLNVKIYNKAIGGSPLSRGKEKSLMDTIAEKTATYGESAEQYSYENLVIPYFDGTIDTCDTLIFDHGFNDGDFPIYYDNVYDDEDEMKEMQWLVTSATTISNLKFVTTDEDTDYDRRDFVQAFGYLRKKLLEINPAIQIVINSNLEKKSTPQAIIASRGANANNIWKGHWGLAVWTIQKLISEFYDLKFNDLAGSLGWSRISAFPNSQTYLADFNTQFGTNHGAYWKDADDNISMYQVFAPDGVHPYTDLTGRSTKILTKVCTEFLNGKI